MSSLFEGLAGIAQDYAGSIRAEVKTNLGPAIPIYVQTAPGQTSIADWLGIKAALIVRDGAGRELATYGQPPPTNWALVGVYAVVLAIAGTYLVKLIRRL